MYHLTGYYADGHCIIRFFGWIADSMSLIHEAEMSVWSVVTAPILFH